MKQMASFYMGMLSPYELEMPRSHDEASSCVVPRPWGWQVSCSLPRPVCTQLPESGTRHEGPRGGVTDLRFDPSQLKFSTFVDFGRAQIRTQVGAIFSPFGHPTQVDKSWSQVIWIFLRLRTFCDLRELASGIANPFRHPSQVRTQILVL